jgi:hypothetical protein
MSDIFRNLKGTSKTEFRLGLSNRGSGLYSGTSDPAGSYTVAAGDVWFDKNNQRLAIRTGAGAWTDVTNTSVVDNRISSTLSSDVTFGAGVTITGNLTVNGTQTVVNTETLNIADNEIVLNSDLASDTAATANAGILVNRGNEGNVFFRWDEGEGEWTVNGETFSAGALIGNLSGNVTGSIAPNGAPNVVKANTLIVNGTYTMPQSDGSANQVLTTNGSGTVTFATPSITPAGSNTQIQYNDSGALGSSGSFTYDEAEAKLTVGGTTSSILFETVSDYGAITSTATDSVDYGGVADSVVALVNSDYGVVETSGGPVEFPQYQVAGVPSASAYTGHMIYVSNESGGSVMAFSDGTNWRRMTDRAVIS